VLPGRRLLLGAVATTLLAGVLTAPSATAETARTDGTPAPTTSSERAADALAIVRDALAPATSAVPKLLPDLAGRASGRAAESTAPRADLTLAMRDLRTHRGELSRADQAEAAQLLARPSGNQTKVFDDRVKVHWPSKGGVKRSFVNKVGKIVTHVLDTYQAAGYRAPKSDGTRGGGRGLLDIYLEDLGVGYYGYCDTDSQPVGSGPYDTPAYCAFNYDYSWAKGNPQANLKVTAAHELFHAVQFAYDYFEDLWFMEATAVWVEDEVYTNVNDNRQYLPQSPLAQPRKSMDEFQGQLGVRQYGDWIFFRYLTERFSKSKGGLPVLIRKMWEYADSTGGNDRYSVQAIKRALKDHGLGLRKAFAQFSSANRRPNSTYSEGSAYPKAPLGRKWDLTAADRNTGWRTARVDHLASTTLRIRPAADMRKGWKLHLRLDLPQRKKGSAAVVTIYPTSGAPKARFVGLDKAGDGTVKTRFNAKAVKRVEVALVNAGTSYQCWQGTNFSCEGKSKDDGRKLKYRAWATHS
jgi:hypothetical protein